MNSTISRLSNIYNKHKILLFWVLINVAGFMLVNISYLKVIDSFFSNSSMLLLVLHSFMYSLIDSLILGAFQLFFLKFHTNSEWIRKWAIRTWISFFLVLMLENVLMYLAANFFIQQRLGIGYSLFPLVGVRIFTTPFINQEVFISILCGVFLGLVYGAIIGLFQASVIRDKMLAKKWFFCVLISLGAGFAFNSILFVFTKYGLYSSYSAGIKYLTILIIALSYSFATLNPLKQLVINNNGEDIK
jgi:hypothetical protein